ncbi:MAG: zinc-dependent alcohol dehydrogenase family protein [Devosia nanyangense]|uniref:Zinc-dependent alcohol dehydrogenase family protein n=1 Tax=Devosia nanyangense TaxID=1228055 RepID=A0A933NV24_9HYPH|nr:zinc-dependent alcohol dehydrogenase family protein [Devosia nanyangense]
MKAARLHRPGEMSVEDVAVPIPGPRDLLVRVEAAGICGSDRHMFRGEYPTALPVTLGHEFCGIVEGVGEDVSQVRVGDRITADPNIACGHCDACRAGRVNLCANLQAIGVTRDGGFAEYVVVPEGQAIVLPAGLDPLLGAFSEPLACCLHGLDVARIKPGDSVAVLGGGVIGLIMVQLARLAGAGSVVLSTRQAPRRELALSLGATHAVDPSAGDAAAAIRAIAPEGVDVALECAGVPETFSQALAVVRRGGAVVLFGVMAKGTTVAVEPFDLLVREVRLESAWLNPHTHARAAAMIAAGQLKLAPLISRIVGTADIPAELMAEPRFGDIKVMVRPG